MEHYLTITFSREQEQTMMELFSLADNGDIEAQKRIQSLMPRLMPILDAFIDGVEKEFEIHPSKPLWEMFKTMAKSENPVHRALVKAYKGMSLADFMESGAEWLKEEFEESAKQLPTPVNSVQQPDIAVLLPEIQDPTDQRIWKWVKEDPSITDIQLAQRLKVSRQTINTRRKSLEKMGYRVRVSRQK